MEGLLLMLHVMVCILLILIVLVQGGRGADLGSAFGGGASQTFFGTRRGNWLTRFTTICAVFFMITSFALTFFYSYRPTLKKELLKEEVRVEEKEAKEEEKKEVE